MTNNKFFMDTTAYSKNGKKFMDTAGYSKNSKKFIQTASNLDKHKITYKQWFFKTFEP